MIIPLTFIDIVIDIIISLACLIISMKTQHQLAIINLALILETKLA